MEVFLAFMRTRSTTVAAKQLDASQSSVSRALSQMESGLGLPLFLRRKGQLLPTPQAEALQAALQSLWEEWQALQRRVAQLRDGRKPRALLRVHVPGVLAAHGVPQAAAALARTHPHVVLDIISGDSRQARAALLAHEADLAVLRLPAAHPRLHAHALVRSAPACLLPAQHPLARRAWLAPGDLAGVGLILPARRHRLRQDIEACLAGARVVPRTCAYYDCTASAARMAALGLGVAIADQCLAGLLAEPALVLRPLQHAPSYDIGWARADDAPDEPLAHVFAGHLQAALVGPAVQAAAGAALEATCPSL